jgi:Ni/Fe-hydrogenase subunit HybB-like protein
MSTAFASNTARPGSHGAPPRAGAHLEAAAPIGGRIWTPFTTTLAGLVLIMLAVTAVRFVRGIGAVSNLNDGYPWGIWIAYDVVIGSALGASGFTVAFATYILNRGAYHPIVRPALLTALFGYVQAGFSVFVDIGRYWGAWHIFAPKYAQTNSVLFEVANCILAYTFVLMIEFLPVVLERFHRDRLKKRLERVLFFFVAVGVLLPSMHQSSLGSLLIVFGPQIDPIYQTNLLPLLFLVSTIGMGLAAVVVEGTASSVALRRPLERELLTKLMKVGQALMAIFLVVRFCDLASRGQLLSLFVPRTLTAMFWIETVLFAAPIALLEGEGRAKPQRFFVAAMSMALAGILYRIDAFLVAYDTGAGWHYFPSMGELAFSIGLIAAELLAFILAVRLLPVLPQTNAIPPSAACA